MPTPLIDKEEAALRQYSRAELLAMSGEELAELVRLTSRGSGSTHATGIVKNSGGQVQYDSDAMPGHYGEASVDLSDFPPGRVPT